MARILILIGMVLLAVTVTAEAATVPVTLKDVITLALENNSQLKAARHHARSAELGVQSATARYLPQLAFEETLLATNSPTSAFIMKLDEGRFAPADFASADAVNHPSTRHDFKTALSLQQPLYVPSLAPLKELAEKDARKAELELEGVRQGVAFQVFAAYLEVLKGHAQVKAADKAVADARENMRLAGIRTDAGVGLRSDQLRARTHVSATEQMHIAIDNNLALARLRLAMLTGASDDTYYEASEVAVAGLPRLSDQLLVEALENRVEMRQSQLDLDKSAAAVKLAKSDYLPTVGAFASYQLNGSDAPFAADNDAWTAGVSLKWQLFDGLRRYSEQKRAVADQGAVREVQEATAKELRYQVKESYLRRAEAGKQLEVARHSLLDAEETVRLLAKRYENSLATLVELLDAQTALNQARSALVDAEAGYALAGGRIYYTMGTFIKEMLK